MAATYELVLQVRDFEGRPTGKTKVFTTKNPEELESFWQRNTSATSKKRRRGGKSGKVSLQDQVARDIDKLTKLERGWDGHNSVPVNHAIANFGKQVVSAVADLFTFKPRSSPISDGRFQLEFSNSKTNKDLELEFTDSETITYLMFDQKSGFTEEKTLGKNEIWKVRECLQWLSK